MTWWEWALVAFGIWLLVIAAWFVFLVVFAARHPGWFD